MMQLIWLKRDLNFFSSDRNLHSIITAVMHISGWEESLIIFLITDKSMIVISHHKSPVLIFSLYAALWSWLSAPWNPVRKHTAPLPGQNRYPSNQIKLQGVKGLRLNKNTWARVRRRGEGAVVCPVQPEERPNSVAPLERQSYWAVDLSCAIPNILGGETQYLHLTLYWSLTRRVMQTMVVFIMMLLHNDKLFHTKTALA